jgi:hypothetical protein
MSLPTPFRPPFQPGSNSPLPTGYRRGTDGVFFRPPLYPPGVGSPLWEGASTLNASNGGSELGD